MSNKPHVPKWKWYLCLRCGVAWASRASYTRNKLLVRYLTCNDCAARKHRL